MARYNSVNPTGSITGGNTITTPASGLLTTITTSGTTTVPNPTLYTGSVQTFYNASGSTIVITTPSGQFNGPGLAGAANLSLPAGAILTITSDGVNYLVTGFPGGPVSTTTLTATGAVTLNPSNAGVSIQPTGTGAVTISSGSPGTMDNVTIGASVQASGKFSSLSATGAATLTSIGAATSYNSAGASLLVSGGVGIAGALYTNSTANFAGNVTISNLGTLTVAGATFHTGNIYYGTTQTSTPGNLALVGQARIHLVDSAVQSSPVMSAGVINDMLVFNAPFSDTAATTSNAGAKWGIRFTGGTTGYYDSLNKSAAIYAVSEDATAGYNRATGLAFYTNQANDVNYAEKVRISNKGYVGINNTSPNYHLDVNGGVNITGTGYLRMTNLTGGGTSSDYWIGRGGIGGGSMAIYAPTGQALEFGIANNSYFQMTSSGNLQFNTSSSTGIYNSAGRPILKQSGSILQVVTTTLSSTTTLVANGSPSPVSGLSATITPSSTSSTIWIIAQIMYASGGTTYGGWFRRNGTDIGLGQAGASQQRVSIGMALVTDANQSNTFVYYYIDSPATTGAVTYQFYVNNDNTGTLYINRSANDINGVTGKRGISTVTLVEIAG
jgi:hypothetical protein